MRLTTLAIVSAAVLGVATTANAQTGSSGSSSGAERGQMQNDQMQNVPRTTGQGQYNWKNDRAPGNPQVHDSTGNAGNTPPPAGGDDGIGRVNSHTQQ